MSRNEAFAATVLGSKDAHDLTKKPLSAFQLFYKDTLLANNVGFWKAPDQIKNFDLDSFRLTYVGSAGDLIEIPKLIGLLVVEEFSKDEENRELLRLILPNWAKSMIANDGLKVLNLIFQAARNHLDVFTPNEVDKMLRMAVGVGNLDVINAVSEFGKSNFGFREEVFKEAFEDLELPPKAIAKMLKMAIGKHDLDLLNAVLKFEESNFGFRKEVLMEVFQDEELRGSILENQDARELIFCSFALADPESIKKFPYKDFKLSRTDWVEDLADGHFVRYDESTTLEEETLDCATFYREFAKQGISILEYLKNKKKKIAEDGKAAASTVESDGAAAAAGAGAGAGAANKPGASPAAAAAKSAAQKDPKTVAK